MEILNKIQQQLKVPKSRQNTFGKYAYRNAEDIVEAVKPLLGDAILTLSDEIVEVGGRVYVKATATLSQGTSLLFDSQSTKPVTEISSQKISVSAYAREPLEQKGMNEAQITGSASSYARKYALNGLFCIDDTQDADSQDNRHEEMTQAMENDGGFVLPSESVTKPTNRRI